MKVKTVNTKDMKISVLSAACALFQIALTIGTIAAPKTNTPPVRFISELALLVSIVLLLWIQVLRVFKGRAADAPNDPKLSDGGARRGSCVVERRESIRAREKGGSEETGPS